MNRIERMQLRAPVAIVYSADAEVRRYLSELLPAGAVRVAVSWEEIQEAAASSRPCILGISDLDEEGTRDQLAKLQRQTRFAPVILVTPFKRENAKRLCGLAIEEVVWWEDAEAILPEVIESLARPSVVGRLAQWIESMMDLDHLLHEAVQAICRADPPLQEVQAEIAVAIHASVAKLECRWRLEFSGSPGLSLRRFVMWVRLLWAVEHIAAGMKPAAAAHRLGIDVRTLTRTATTLTNCSLGNLVRRGPEYLLDRAVNELERSHIPSACRT